MKIYDLRSDTITKPTAGMRKAIYDAEVGDDVYGDDPTVLKLQEKAAELVGKEAALFVPSGSMGNLIPIYLLCGKGNEIVAHRMAHILHYEMASVSAIAGSMPVPVDGAKGVVHPEAVAPVIRPDIYYLPRTKMIEIENTHNRAGGTYYRPAEIEAIGAFANERGLYLHIDGARMFNAAVASGMDPKTMCRRAETVTFCLSKGLGAPVGSMLCGDAPFIAEARRVRKLLGGGMRQAGVLAAAGLYALENNIPRLADDHANARALAEALAAVDWAVVDMELVETNIVYFRTPGRPAADVAAALKANGVLCGATAPDTIRMVTSLEVTAADIDAVRGILAGLAL